MIFDHRIIHVSIISTPHPLSAFPPPFFLLPCVVDYLYPPKDRGDTGSARAPSKVYSNLIQGKNAYVYVD